MVLYIRDVKTIHDQNQHLVCKKDVFCRNLTVSMALSFFSGYFLLRVMAAVTFCPFHDSPFNQ
jgi:hypothetical protein